jgi:PAS domain S-box-containing protein
MMKVRNILPRVLKTRSKESNLFFCHRLFTTKTSNPEHDKNKYWSQTISYGSPESDFTGTDMLHDLPEEMFHIHAPTWSGTLLFASPESDFTSDEIKKNETLNWKKRFFELIHNNEPLMCDLSYSLSHASDTNDFENPMFLETLNERMKTQLRNVTNHREKYSLVDHANPREVLDVDHNYVFDSKSMSSNTRDRNISQKSNETPLPQNLFEATIPQDPRAIVVTEATVPFRIVSVNDTWEKLCGYTPNECRGKTLKIIQGPETNESAITNLMSKLLKGEEAGTLLTNYDKNGRKFLNRLRVGPLKNQLGQITHFVGVLKEVSEMDENFETMKA